MRNKSRASFNKFKMTNIPVKTKKGQRGKGKHIREKFSL
jgi:hypothetical protein